MSNVTISALSSMVDVAAGALKDTPFRVPGVQQAFDIDACVTVLVYTGRVSSGGTKIADSRRPLIVQ